MEKSTTLEGSIFARVLGRLMEAHLPRAANEEKALELAEWCEYDVDVFRVRLHGDPEANPGDLSRLSYELGLSADERRKLALAYIYERDTANETEPPTEYEEDLVYLTEFVGASKEESGQILLDQDLFLTPPGTRCAFEPEEAVRVWKEAEARLCHIADAQAMGGVFGENQGIEMLLWDAASRAGKLLKRAEEHIEASAE